MREKLFFDDPPLIADYAGTGRLGAWLRRIVLRSAIKRTQRDRRSTDIDELEEMPGLENDPEMAYLSRNFGSAVKRAISDVLATLSSDERSLLRRNLLEGSSIDAIASGEGVHRATAARHLAKLRKQIVGEVHRKLGSQLGLSRDEVAAMGGILADDLELSLPRQLATKNDEKTSGLERSRK